MTVQTTLRTAGPYVGNGVTTQFAFDFKVFEKSDLQVIRKTTATGTYEVLTLDSHYSVTLNADQDNDPGGFITYPLSGANLPGTQTISMLSVVPETQLTDITNQGGFFPNVVEAMVDKAVILYQQIAEKVGRSFRVPPGESAVGDLPSAVQRALKYLAFDGDGAPIASEGVLGVPVESTLQLTDNIADLIALASPSTAVMRYVLGYYDVNDGGGGMFVFVVGDTTDEDDGTIFAPAAGGSGRWHRMGASTAARIKVRWFGGKGDGTTNDRMAVKAAIEYCKAVQGDNNNPSLLFGAGQWLLDYIPGGAEDGPIMLDMKNHGIAFIGDPDASAQQGSVRPTCVIRAGANTDGAVFEVITDAGPPAKGASYLSFIGMAVENGGNATNFFRCPNRETGHLLFQNFWCQGGANGPASYQFSESVIYTQNLNYSRFDHVEFAYAAPVDILLDGNSTPNGTSRVWIGRMHVTSIDLDHVAFKLINGSVDALTIQDFTCDAQGAGKLVLVDTTGIGSAGGTPCTVGSLRIIHGESDDISNNSTARLLKLLRCRSVTIEGVQANGSGAAASLVQIEDCAVAWGPNDVQSFAGPIIAEIGTLNRVTEYGPGLTRVGTTRGLLATTSVANGISLAPVPATTNVPLNGHLQPGGGFVSCKFRVTDNQNYTIYVPLYSQNPQGTCEPNTTYEITVINASGGAMGSISFDAGVLTPTTFFKTKGAFTSPANGKARSIRFYYDGQYMWETGRGDADVG